MKSAYIFLIIFVMITVSCSDEPAVLDIPEEVIGGLVFEWAISQKSTGDFVRIEVGTYYYERTEDRYIRKIYLHEETLGEFSRLCADISNEDWDRVQNNVQGLFITYPDDMHSACCNETLAYSETLQYIRGVHECIIRSKRIEGCTDKDIETVRELFKELKEIYFPE